MLDYVIGMFILRENMVDNRTEILRKMTLLYVEDDADITDAVKFSFSNSFDRIFMLPSAEEALERLDEIKPDIIITDIGLPYMNGLEFTKKLKEINEDIPVIVISGHREEEYFINCIESGVDYFMSKPINLKLLKQKLHKIAEKTVRERSLENNRKLMSKVLDGSRELYIAGDENSISYMNSTLLELLGFSDVDEANDKMMHENCVHIVENSSKERQIPFGSWVNFVKHMDGYESMVNFLMEGTLKSDAKSYITRVSRVKDEDSYIISFVDVTVIERQKQFFHNLAIKDPLTEIFNRHKFNEEIVRETERSRRYGVEYSVIMFDIDKFKDVNDKYGHQVGDTVLKELAELVSANIRTTDIFSRYGGEEFIIITPEVNAEGALKLAEKLRVAIEEHPFTHVGRITCSFGVADHSKEMSTHELIHKADEAMYRAKAEGRNRVSMI